MKRLGIPIEFSPLYNDGVPWRHLSNQRCHYWNTTKLHVHWKWFFYLPPPPLCIHRFADNTTDEFFVDNNCEHQSCVPELNRFVYNFLRTRKKHTSDPFPKKQPTSCLIKIKGRGTWMAQLVKCPTAPQVMISQSMGSSPASGFALTAQAWSLLQILWLPLSLPLPCSRSVSLCLKNK